MSATVTVDSQSSSYIQSSTAASVADADVDSATPSLDVIWPDCRERVCAHTLAMVEAT